MRKIPREVQKVARIKSNFSLSKIQKEVLIGTIIGDGSFYLRGNYHRLHVKHSIRQKFYVDYKHMIFSNITNMPVRVFNQCVGKKDYGFCEFVTLTHSLFSKYQSLFYKGNKKIIPDTIFDYMNSPLSLAVWFMDDGGAEYAGLSISTHCFTKKEVNVLKKVLKMNFNLDTSLRRNKGRWIIYIPKKEIGKFKYLVTRYILPEFKYKLIPYSIRQRTP